MDNNINESKPVINVENMVQDIQNTVWGILESHGIEVPSSQKWSAMYRYTPTRPKKKKEDK